MGRTNLPSVLKGTAFLGAAAAAAYLFRKDDTQTVNPVADADPPSVKYDEMSIWSLDEISKFLQHCKGERHYLTFLLAIYTGMRRGEILGLQWSDIDFDKKMIQVCRSLAYVPEIGYMLTTLKTKNSKRQIPIPEFVLHELRVHKQRQEEWKGLVGKLYEDNDLEPKK